MIHGELLPNGLVKHTLPPPVGLIDGDTVFDIGAGIRPMNWYVPKRHICVEPHGQYSRKLEAAGYETWCTTAHQALWSLSPGEIDVIYMLDVIEHMARPVGEKVLALAQALKPKQIVIATPNGYTEQDSDPWDCGAEFWQTHRSGWVPEDFPGWVISYYEFEAYKGFMAVST